MRLRPERERLGRGGLALLLALALSLRGTVALGQPASASEEQRAALFREGVTLADAGKWEEAVVRFRRVVAIRPAPKALFTLGQAEEKVGRIASAAKAYRSVERTAGPGDSDAAKAAADALGALLPRVPRVRILVTGTRDATATVDGETASTLLPVELDPGDHEILVRAPNTRDFEKQVTVAPGDRLIIEAGLGSGAVHPEEPLTKSASASRIPVLPLVVGGAGVVGLGVGTGLMVAALSKKSDSDSSGCTGDVCTPGAASIRNDARGLGNAATAAFVTGSVLLAGGLALWLLLPSDKPPAEAKLAFSPALSPRFLGITLKGSL